MKQLEYIPPTSYDLIEELDAAFPHQCIQPQDTPESAHRYAGKRELIDHLKLLLERTEEEALLAGLES